MKSGTSREKQSTLRMGTMGVCAGTVRMGEVRTAFSALKGNYLQRRGDPQLFHLAYIRARSAVIVNVVALHC